MGRADSVGLCLGKAPIAASLHHELNKPCRSSAHTPLPPRYKKHMNEPGFCRGPVDPRTLVDYRWGHGPLRTGDGGMHTPRCMQDGRGSARPRFPPECKKRWLCG